jgi:catechol 2,3-dioxygenase-like lactoylglutathione lyase family enzyme
MRCGLDHIVHAVRDLDTAAALYQSLGFTVGEPEKIEPHGARSFSFGAFHRDYLARGQGVAMMLLHARDAKADADAFRAHGIGDFEVFNFERQGKRPDGSTVKLAFSLVFAADPAAPEAGFGACQHYYPENFWNPEFQKHANRVTGIAGLVLVAGDPRQHRDFLKAYTGAETVRDSGDGFAIGLANTTIEMMTPAAFTGRFAAPAPDTSFGARFAAIRFAGGPPKAVQAVSGAVLAFDGDNAR